MTSLSPGSSDNLAQRNILFDFSDNPGTFAAHLVHHTFELEPSPTPFPQDHYLTGAFSAGPFARDGFDTLDEDVETGLETGVEVVARARLPERPEDPPQRRDFPRRPRLDPR